MSLPSVLGYLAAQAQGPNMLAQLLREPEVKNGVLHTPREIAQQPLLWRYTAKKMNGKASELHTFLDEWGMYDEANRPSILLLGAGTSDYVGLSIVDLLRKSFKTSATNCATTRITASPEAYVRPDQRYVMIHFARSGNSPESRAVLDFALSHHAERTRHIVITCNADGSLANLARKHPDNVFLVVLDKECNDQALAMTTSYSSMVVAGQALAYLTNMKAFIAQIHDVSRAGEYVLETYSDLLFQLSRPSLERAIFLGSVDLLGAATESALKIQELTNGEVMATSEDTLALRHGPISAVNHETLICFFLSANEYTRKYELDVLYQYQDAFGEFGAETLVVSGEALNSSVESHVTKLVYKTENTPSLPVFFQVQIAAMVGQLLGLFSSYRRHLNVDSPSAGADLYSRTVQGVQLYEYPNGHTS